MSSLKKHIQVSHNAEYESLVKTGKCKYSSHNEDTVDLLECKEFIGENETLLAEEEENLLMNNGQDIQS